MAEKGLSARTRKGGTARTLAGSVRYYVIDYTAFGECAYLPQTHDRRVYSSTVTKAKTPNAVASAVTTCLRHSDTANRGDDDGND